MGTCLPGSPLPNGQVEEEQHCPWEGDEDPGQEESEHPVPRRVVQPPSCRGADKVAHALAEEEEAVTRAELLQADQLHQDRGGEAVVGRDAEAVGGGEEEDEGGGVSFFKNFAYLP